MFTQMISDGGEHLSPSSGLVFARNSFLPDYAYRAAAERSDCVSGNIRDVIFLYDLASPEKRSEAMTLLHSYFHSDI